MPNRYSIVGMSYRLKDGFDAYGFMKDLPVGTIATLVREPNNAHDPNAVKVVIEGQHVGYVPKSHNKVLAQFIDAHGVMAMDEAVKTLKGIFVRSPNSGYPMVEV